jgi:hypothetical protein
VASGSGASGRWNRPIRSLRTAARIAGLMGREARRLT